MAAFAFNLVVALYGSHTHHRPVSVTLEKRSSSAGGNGLLIILTSSVSDDCSITIGGVSVPKLSQQRDSTGKLWIVCDVPPGSVGAAALVATNPPAAGGESATYTPGFAYDSAPRVTFSSYREHSTVPVTVTITASRASAIYYRAWPNDWTHTAAGQTSVQVTLNETGPLCAFAIGDGDGLYSDWVVGDFVVNRSGYPKRVYDSFFSPEHWGDGIETYAGDRWTIKPDGMTGPLQWAGTNGLLMQVIASGALVPARPSFSNIMLWGADSLIDDQRVFAAHAPPMESLAGLIMARVSEDGLSGYGVEMIYYNEGPPFGTMTLVRYNDGVITQAWSVGENAAGKDGDNCFYWIEVTGHDPVRIKVGTMVPDVWEGDGYFVTERDADGDGTLESLAFFDGGRDTRTWPRYGVAGWTWQYGSTVEDNSAQQIRTGARVGLRPGNNYGFAKFFAEEVYQLSASTQAQSGTTATLVGYRPADAPVTVTGAAAAMTTASRTSGVAPLYVFFDAVDVATNGTAAVPTYQWASGVTQPSDMEGAHFSWSFGDASSGTWGAVGTWAGSGRSKDASSGYVAAHVYETPGTYTATLTVTDTLGFSRRYTQAVTVSAFAGDTAYASAAGDDLPVDLAGGEGTEANPVTLARGLTWVNGGTNRRLLLNRGDTFSAAGATLTQVATAAGPNIIGAYGTGDRPIWNVSSGAAANVQGNGWRLLDLDIRYATSLLTDPHGVTSTAGNESDDVLVLRVKTTGFRVGLGNNYPATGDANDSWAFVECESTGSGMVQMWMGGKRSAILGCHLHDVSLAAGTGEHVCRVFQAHKFVASHNNMAEVGGTGEHALKLEGRDADGGFPESQWMVLTDNRFYLGNRSAYVVSIGSQSGLAAETTRQSHLLFERNLIVGGTTTTLALECETPYTVVRNNVIDFTTRYGSGNCRIFRFLRRGDATLLPDGVHDVKLYNNTIHSDTVSGTLYLLVTNSTLTNAAARNNLLRAPSVTLLDGTPGTGWVQDHNLLTTAAASTIFADAAAGDFSLVANVATVDAGAALAEVREDYTRVVRPVGSAIDIGAYEKSA